MKKTVIVTDIGYGDAGKGSIVDYLARDAESTLVVRHNGGPQAAHNVVTPDGRHHTFAQLGSASFLPNARTHLSRFMLVNPFNIIPEIEHLESLGVRGLWDRLTIDGDAIVITPWHVSANRIREIIRGQGRHGSCGQGIGEVMFDSIHFPEAVLRVADLGNREVVIRKLNWFRNLKLIQLSEQLTNLPDIDQAHREREVLESTKLIESCADFYIEFLRSAQVVHGDRLASLMSDVDLTLFEGAQGVLLDQDYGFHPYTTWSTTTQANAQTLLSEIDLQTEVSSLALLRGYMVRHGAGPFVSESVELTRAVPDYHNGTNDWQHGFRVGHLDFVALRYALAANGGADALVVTNLDRMEEVAGWKSAHGYILPERHSTSPYFQGINDGVALDIRLGPKNRRDYQETITNVLLETKPFLKDLSEVGGRDYLQLIEDELGVPISIVSHGPKATDKYLVM